MIHTPLPSTPLVMILEIFSAPNVQSKYLENRRTSQWENSSPRTGARFSENRSTVLREPEHGSPRTRARFFENQSTVLQEPENGSPRTRTRFFKNQSTVLREPEHSSLRIRAHLSWRTGKHLHVLHVLRTYSTCSHPGW